MPSAVIREVHYNADRHELTVVFTGGRVYVYALVPVAAADALAAAPSKGAYFNAHIRDRYPHRRASRPAPAKGTVPSLADALRASHKLD